MRFALEYSLFIFGSFYKDRGVAGMELFEDRSVVEDY